MALGNVTIYSTGWECPNCSYYNSFPSKTRIGDSISCHKCTRCFLINTMTLDPDPNVQLENKRRLLEDDVRDLVAVFVKDTQIIPEISITTELNHRDKKSTAVIIRVKLQVKHNGS